MATQVVTNRSMSIEGNRRVDVGTFSLASGEAEVKTRLDFIESLELFAFLATDQSVLITKNSATDQGAADDRGTFFVANGNLSDVFTYRARGW